MRTHYSLLDEMLASPTDPMPEDLILLYGTRLYECLHSIEQDEKPTDQQWKILADCVMMTETLVREMKICEDSGLLQEAIDAMNASAVRYLKGGAVRLDGKGIQAMRAISEDFVDLLKALPHRTWVRCHRLTEKRVYIKKVKHG